MGRINKKKYEKALEKLRSADFVTILTGAGISKESGISTFRGDGGLWNKFSPEELANIEAFYKNPALVSEWYEYRRHIIQKTSPNKGHIALFEMSKMVEKMMLITQNVDGLHQKAGNENVIELHGNIMRNYCVECLDEYTLQEFEKMYEKSNDHIVRCKCGGLIRPDVVWFGESLPENELEQAFEGSVETDIFMAVGTSALVRPAADFPMLAKANGAFLIEINPEETVISDIADVSFKQPASVVLDELVRDL